MASQAAAAQALDAWARDQVDLAIARYRDSPGPLIQVLHAVQAALGCVPPSVVPIIAAALNLSRAEVHGVITFYHHFRDQPSGRHVLKVCQAEACRSMRGAELTAHVKRALGIDFHQTTSDGRITLEPVYCLGNCACSPALLLDETLYGRVTPESVDALLASEDCQ